MKHLGVFQGPLRNGKEAWRWTEEARKAITAKKEAFKKWTTCDQNLQDQKKALQEEYQRAKKISARAVAKAQAATKQDFYEDLESPAGSRKIFKIAAMQRSQAKILVALRYIEDKERRLLTKREDVCNRLQEFMQYLPKRGTPVTHSENHRNGFYGLVIGLIQILVYKIDLITRFL